MVHMRKLAGIFEKKIFKGLSHFGWRRIVIPVSVSTQAFE